MKYVKFTYRGYLAGNAGQKRSEIRRVTDEFALERVGNLLYSAKAEYVDEPEQETEDY
jgi:hypothetical protein